VLAGTQSRVELAAQAVVLGLQVLGPLLERLSVATEDRFHISIVHRRQTCSSANGRQGMDQFELVALIKYPVRI
jgi:hypothetical protein